MNKAVEIGKRIKLRREELNMTQEDLGKCLCLNKSTIQRYETGQVKTIKLPVIQSIAIQLQVNPNWLALKTDDPHIQDEEDRIFERRPVYVKELPVFTEIACGKPIYTDGQIKCYVPVGDNVEADFCIVASGDSMINARINDGDIVFIKETSVINDGEIAAVWIDGEGATLKRIYRQDDVLTLVAENPKYPPMVFPEERNHEVRLIGKAIAFQSNIG